MGAFSDINSVMPNGYEVVYNNEREMFKDNSAKNLFSSTSYYPIGRRENTYNEQTEWNSNPPPYLDYQVLPNYITDASYLFFLSYNGDGYLNLQFSNNLKNVSHMFAFCPSWDGVGAAFDVYNGIHGTHYPDSIEDASGLFKGCSFGAGRAINFIRNMPQNLKSLNNTFFCTYGMYGQYLPMKDSHNNYILDKYENLFNIWFNQGGLSSSTSNFMYYANYYYCNNENGYDDRRFVNSTIPDSVEYMNGTFALSSIGIDDYYLASNNDIDFHLPNNLKDASFCFFNTGYLNNFQFNLPDSLTEANYMFATCYGYNFPNRVTFGNGLINAVGMFAQLSYSGGSYVTDVSFPQNELPNNLKNAKMMFYGCNLYKLFNLPRSVEDISFMYAPGGKSDRLYGLDGKEYIIPNTVKNVDFLFANLNMEPNNRQFNQFFENEIFKNNDFDPYRYPASPTYLNNFNLHFEEGSNLNSVRGLFLGVNVSNSHFDIPNSVKDISFLMYGSGTYYNAVGGENFFNNILKENIEEAAYAFAYGYYNNDVNIYMPSNLKNISGMFYNSYLTGVNPPVKMNLIELENTKVENAAYFLTGSGFFTQPIYFPNTVEDLSYALAGTSFRGEYPIEGQEENWRFSLENFTNLKKCDYLFAGCSYFNVNITFPSSLKTMEGVFSGCYNFNQNILLPEGLTSAYKLFDGCNNFDQPIQLPQTLENAAYLFNNCSNFNFGGESDLNFAYLTNLKDMSYMFDSCYNLNKIINEQTFQWPPHIEQISKIFNNCPKIEIDTFVIPSSIKDGNRILDGATITNGILIQGGEGILYEPFSNLKGKQIDTDGNYYFNSVIIELGNREISSTSESFINTNVKDVIFKNGNLSMKGYNYYNQLDNIGFYIFNSNKFNGNIIFDNVGCIYGDTGCFKIYQCNNFNKPITFPPFIYNYQNNAWLDDLYYLILGDLPKREIINDDYYSVTGNYLYISVDQEDPEGTQFKAYLRYHFSENNTDFKEALNQLINSPNDLMNIYYNINNYPNFNMQEISSGAWDNNYGAREIVDNCDNFNSPLRFEYGTASMYHVVEDCPNFNTTIEIPSSVTYLNGLVVNCNNYNQLVVIPGSVKTAVSVFSLCSNFNTAPLLGDGIKTLNEMFYGSKLFNKTVFLPDSLENARYLFGSCTNYNQETSFKNARILTGALSLCSNYNSYTYFNFGEEKELSHIFYNDYLFDKDIDFNCPSIISAESAFHNCKNFNSNVINSSFRHKKDNYFTGSYAIFGYNVGEMNYSLNSGLSLRGHNFFYYPNEGAAINGTDFYKYNTDEWWGDATSMFSGCNKFNAEQIPNFHNCKQTGWLFSWCYNFNRPVDLFETEVLNNTFNECHLFNQQLIFNSEIISIGNGFQNCYNLSYIPVFLKGINISSSEEYYWYDGVRQNEYKSYHGFYCCHNLGKDQQGEDYAINFSVLSPGGTGSNQWRRWFPGGEEFFYACWNLNVPLNIDRMYGFPDRFLGQCANFNSNIYINRSINNYYNEGIALTGNETFWNCKNFNKPFVFLQPNFYISNLGGNNFFNGCSNYNQPVQEWFCKNAKYNEYYPDGILELTAIHEKTFSGCSNFNQPILDYYFDNAEKRLIGTVDYPYTLNFDFGNCCNFNQRIQGNFYHSHLGFYNFNFTNCFLPDGMVKINWYYDHNQAYSWGGFNAPHLNLGFGLMKVLGTEPNRTMYFNIIANVNCYENTNGNFNVSLTHISTVVDNYSESGYLPSGYSLFFPENFHIDLWRNNLNYPMKIYLSGNSTCFYVGENQQSNHIMKNFEWFPTMYNDPMEYTGPYNYSNSNFSGYFTLFYGMDCGYIDIWNIIFNRNNITNFFGVTNFIDEVYNLKQDFHFEPTTKVHFQNCNNIFNFMPNCEVNIYINTFNCFNIVNRFAAGKNVNIYIANDLYFEDTRDFFGKDNGNYYIGNNTIFNNISNFLPRDLKTNFNIQQFNFYQGLYSFKEGNYIFNETESLELDYSAYNFKYDAFKSASLSTEMLIINNVPYDRNYENALFFQTRNLSNVKINSSYRGDTGFCNVFFLTYDYFNLAYMKQLNIVDETNTYMRVYIKKDTPLYNRLSNVYNGINIFQNTYYNYYNGKFANYITVEKNDSEGISYYNTKQGVYYNIVWY